LWDSRAPKLVDTIELADAVTDIDYIPSKESVVAACKKGVYFYSYSQGKLQAEQVFDRTHLGFDAESVSLHPTLPRFIVGGSDFNVHVFDSLSGRELGMDRLLLPAVVLNLSTQRCTRSTTGPSTLCATRPTEKSMPRALTTAPSVSGKLPPASATDSGSAPRQEKAFHKTGKGKSPWP